MCWDDQGAHCSKEHNKLNQRADDLRNKKMFVFKHKLWLHKEQEYKEKQQSGPKSDRMTVTFKHLHIMYSSENTNFSIFLSCSSSTGTDAATLSQTRSKCWFCSQLCPSLLGALVVLCYGTQSHIWLVLPLPNTYVGRSMLSKWYSSGDISFKHIFTRCLPVRCMTSVCKST